MRFVIVFVVWLIAITAFSYPVSQPEPNRPDYENMEYSPPAEEKDREIPQRVFCVACGFAMGWFGHKLFCSEEIVP